MQHSTKPGRHFWFPARHLAATDFHSVAHWTVLHNVQGFSICPQTRLVVQVCTVCSVVWSHRILPDLLVLLAGRSYQLTHSWCHRCAVRSHCERPRCPIRLATELTRIHVCFCQEILLLLALKLDCASACAAADRCDVSSFATASNCEACSVINSRNCCTSSDVAMSTHHNSCNTSFSSRTLLCDSTQDSPQVRTNAPLPCTNLCSSRALQLWE